MVSIQKPGLASATAKEGVPARQVSSLFRGTVNDFCDEKTQGFRAQQRHVPNLHREKSMQPRRRYCHGPR